MVKFKNLVMGTALAIAALMVSLSFATTFEATENIQFTDQPFAYDSTPKAETVTVEYQMIENFDTLKIDSIDRGVIQLAEDESHTLKSAGSSPAPATTFIHRHRRE